MVRTITTISIDPDIRTESMTLLKTKGITLSFYIEQCLRQLINNEDRKVKGG